MTTMLVTTSGIRMYVAAWSMPTICCLSGPASLVPIEFWPIWENPKPSAEEGRKGRFRERRRRGAGFRNRTGSA